MGPLGAGGQVHAALALARLHHRGHQQAGAKEVGVLAGPGGAVPGEVVEQRAHHRGALFVGGGHLLLDVGPQPLPQEHVLLADFVVLLPKAPHLVGRAGKAGGPAGGALLGLGGIAVPVEAHHRAEGPVLEPPGQQLLEGGVGGVAAVEAADVRGPPGDAGDAHVQPGGELVAEALKAGVDVAAPHQGAVLLRARPGAPQQVDDVLLALGLHAVEEGLGVKQGVAVAHLGVGPQVVAVVVKVVGGVLRLGLVQPEDAHALVVVVLLGDAPHIVPGGGVGGVVVDGAALELHGHPHAPVGADEQPLLQHLPVAGVALIHRGPNGHHQLYAHLFQLGDHGVGVRPIGGVELPVPLQGPVEEVHHNHRDGQSPLFVLPGDGEQLLLGLVAQLALPKAHGEVGHHRHGARHGGVLLLHLGGGVPGGDPVVQNVRGHGLEGGDVLAEDGPAHGGVVPQKAVAPGGQEEGYAGLGVALGQLQVGAL